MDSNLQNLIVSEIINQLEGDFGHFGDLNLSEEKISELTIKSLTDHNDSLSIQKSDINVDIEQNTMNSNVINEDDIIGNGAIERNQFDKKLSQAENNLGNKKENNFNDLSNHKDFENTKNSSEKFISLENNESSNQNISEEKDIIFDSEYGNGILLKNPEDLSAVFRMKSHTPARIGVGKAGPRLKTKTLLKLRADHALARDAVFKDVDEELLKKLNLETFVTKCKDKNEFLTRPDLGKQFENAELEKIKNKIGQGHQIVIYGSDGLSSTAINSNFANIMPVLSEGLKMKGFDVSLPFYVKYGRVGTQDILCETLNADVVCVLIGERPGLATAESMSAYITYKATVGMPEARRTVVSNIHKGGTTAVEAGAYIVEVIAEIYKQKASGVELKKQGDML